MMQTEAEDAGSEPPDSADQSGVRVQIRFGGKQRQIVVADARVEQARQLAHTIVTAPFTRRTWNELFYFCVSGLLMAVATAYIGATMFAGVVLFITFVGVILIGCSTRGARGFGALYRRLAAGLLDEQIEEPAPFVPQAGFLGWLRSTLRDRTGWRAIAYTIIKIPLWIFGTWFALSVWIDAISSLGYPFWGHGLSGPPVFGVFEALFGTRSYYNGSTAFFHTLAIVVLGIMLVFLAPWPMRAVVYVDRRLMQWLLSPDPVTARMRSLERARTQTVDASAATLRRIERDLHDGTQAQLVALAMQLGQAKEKLAEPGEVDIERVRQLVDDAHQGAKEAIVELRDIARGIHPPVLDVGLEGALSTLAARSAVPTEVTVALRDRPTPAIEAIAYFCVAELLANVAQHAKASRASVACNQLGDWLRIVVRDDGRGGAQPALVGSSSSGLRGLMDRVFAVDGSLSVASPMGGPTVVIVDLPLRPR
jgi:signal transduction histidine kinase